MPAWTNRAVFQAPRNGTTSHTIDPSSTVGLVAGAAFTPTAGRLLVVVVEGAVTSSTPSGWTLPSGGSAISDSGLYVWYRTAAGGDTFATTHNGSNYPVVFVVYEFPAGSTFVKSASGTGVSNTGANPNLTGLSGTNLIVGVKATAMASGWTYGGAVWSSGYTEDYDDSVPFSSTDGYWLTVAAQEGVTASSAQPTATISGTAFTAEALTFAVKVPAGGNAATLQATAPRPTFSASGQAVNRGTLAATAPRASVAATGAQVNSGALTATAPLPDVSAAGVQVNPGAVSATAPLATLTASGQATNPGVLSATAPAATFSAQDTATNPGTLQADAPRPTLTAVGAQRNPATLTAAAPLPAVAGAGTARNPGIMLAEAPRPVFTATGVLVNPGSLAAAAPLPVFTATDVSGRNITVTASLHPPRWAGAPTPPRRAGTIHSRRWGAHL